MLLAPLNWLYEALTLGRAAVLDAREPNAGTSDRRSVSDHLGRRRRLWAGDGACARGSAAAAAPLPLTAAGRVVGRLARGRRHPPPAPPRAAGTSWVRQGPCSAGPWWRWLSLLSSARGDGGTAVPPMTAAGGGEVPRHSGWTGARHNGDSLPGLFESHHPIPPIPCPCTRPPHIPIRMLYQIFRTATGAHAPPALPLTSTPASPCALDEESPLPPNERVVFP